MNSFLKSLNDDPYARHLGISVDHIAEGSASCSLTVKEYMFNFLGAVHGGLVFSLADVAFSAASNNDHRPSYALDVNGSFLKTAKLGDVIRAEAKRIHTSKRVGVYEMRVFNNEDLIATFNGTVFRKIERSKDK